MAKKIVGVVLAAGLGTRLRPSTEKCPKPLIPVGGIEPLFFAIHQAYQVGVRRMVVNAHYLSEHVEQALVRWAPIFAGLELRISIEKPEILGTGGGILKIVRDNADWFRDSGLLLQNGDTLAQIDIARLVERPERNTLAISLLDEHLKKYNPLWIDGQGTWAGIGKVSPVAGAVAAHFLGVHHLSPKAIQSLTGDGFEVRSIDLFNGIYRPLVNLGQNFESVDFFQNHGVGDSEFWFDMTTQEYLLEAQRHVLETLPRNGVWGQILKQRYPSIREHSPGVWTRTHRKPGTLAFKAPAIFVDSLDDSQNLVFDGKLTVGPNASFIHETQKFSVDGSRGADREIQNSVVFAGPSTRGILPVLVHDQICVI